MAVLIADPNAHPSSLEFYASFPSEPIVGGRLLTCTQRRSSPDLTLLALFEGLAGGGDAVVVCHGNPDGLAIRLAPGGPPMRPEHVELLTNSPARNDPGAMAAGLRVDVQMARRLIQARERMLQHRVGHVAFRACYVGATAELTGSRDLVPLSALRRLFGAQRVCAPTLLDGFGRLRLVPDPDRQDTRLTVIGTTNGFEATLFAPDRAHAHAWMRASFPPPHHFPSDGAARLHALLVPHGAGYDAHLPTSAAFQAALRSDP